MSFPLTCGFQGQKFEECKLSVSCVQCVVALSCSLSLSQSFTLGKRNVVFRWPSEWMAVQSGIMLCFILHASLWKLLFYLTQHKYVWCFQANNCVLFISLWGHHLPGQGIKQYLPEGKKLNCWVEDGHNLEITVEKFPYKFMHLKKMDCKYLLKFFFLSWIWVLKSKQQVAVNSTVTHTQIVARNAYLLLHVHLSVCISTTPTGWISVKL